MFFLITFTFSLQQYCFYSTDASLCPEDTQKYTVNEEGYNKFQNDCQNFSRSEGDDYVFYFTTNMEFDSKKFEIKPTTFQNWQNNISFIGIGDEKKIIYVEIIGKTFYYALEYKFQNVHVNQHSTESATYTFKDVTLRKTTFDAYSTLKADTKLDSDWSSLAPFPTFSSKSIILSMNEFPTEDTHIFLSSVITNDKFVICDIEGKANMTLFGDELVFGHADATGKAFIDFSAATKAPIVLINKDNTEFEVYCEFFTPHDYLPLYVVNITSSSQVIIPESHWPVDLGAHGLVELASFNQINARIYLNCEYCPLDINVRGLLPDWTYNTLSIITGKSKVNLTGTLFSENLDLTITTTLNEDSILTFDNIYEYGAYGNYAGVYYATGIWAKNESPNLLVYIKEITKIDYLNSSSTFSGAGKWQFEDFPTTSGGTAIANLVIDPTKVYHINYNYVNATGGYAAPLACSGETSGSTYTFTDPTNRKFKIMPVIYNGDNLPNKTYLKEEMIFGQYYIYMNNLKTADVEYEFLFPERGPSGFQKSTMVFDFVQKGYDITMNQKGEKTIFDFSYQFCISADKSVCNDDYIHFQNTETFNEGYKQYLDVTQAFQIEFYLFTDFDFDFSNFTKNSIDVSFVGNDKSNPNKVTVDSTFFTSEKFQNIYAKNVLFELKENVDLSVTKIDLLPSIELDDASFSSAIIDILDCTNTEVIKADPESFDDIHNKCVPKKLVLEDSKFNTIEIGNNLIKFINQEGGTSKDISITINNERPIIDIDFDGSYLTLKAGENPTLSQNVNISMATSDHTINISSSFTSDIVIDKLTISNINGIIKTSVATIPFLTNNIVKVDIQSETLNEVTVTKPFNIDAIINTQSGLHLLYKDITFNQPSNRVTSAFMESVKFDGTITFTNSSGVRIIDFDFKNDDATTIDIQYRLENLPYIVLDSVSAISKVPKEIKLTHYGADEFEQIQNLPDYYDDLHYDILCGNKIDCSNWKTNIHDEYSSVFNLTCRQNPKTNEGKCLTLSLITKDSPTQNPAIENPATEKDDENVAKTDIEVDTSSSSTVDDPLLDENKNALTHAEIAGIAVGCVAAVVIIVVVVICVISKKNKYNNEVLTDLEELTGV